MSFRSKTGSIGFLEFTPFLAVIPCPVQYFPLSVGRERDQGVSFIPGKVNKTTV
jgi:hypothetical protein